MRFVATKTPEQQSGLILHRTRHLFIRQQTAVINAIRAHLAEFGIVAAVGRNGLEQLLNVVADAGDRRLPEVAPPTNAMNSRRLMCAPLGSGPSIVLGQTNTRQGWRLAQAQVKMPKWLMSALGH
jgi:hypothetical protein